MPESLESVLPELPLEPVLPLPPVEPTLPELTPKVPVLDPPLLEALVPLGPEEPWQPTAATTAAPTTNP